MARNAIAKVNWSEDERALTFHFSNDDLHIIDIANIPEGLHAALTLHGLEQKLRDSYAGAKTVDEAIAAFTATADTLRSGEWGKRREGAGPSQPALTVETVMLMAETKGKPFADAETAKVWIARMKEKSLLASVKATPEYVAAENAIRTRRAAASTLKVNLDEVL